MLLLFVLARFGYVVRFAVMMWRCRYCYAQFVYGLLRAVDAVVMMVCRVAVPSNRNQKIFGMLGMLFTNFS